MSKNCAFTENATPPTCYIAGSRDSGILTSFRPFAKLIDSNFDFGSFGVTGVKSSFSLKMRLLIQYTLKGHVTYAHKQACRPFTKLIDSNFDLGTFGVTGVKKVIFTKYATPPTYDVVWSCDLCTWYTWRPARKSYYFNFWSKVIWGHRGQKVISTKSDITRPSYIAWLQNSYMCISLTPSTNVVGQGSTSWMGDHIKSSKASSWMGDHIKSSKASSWMGDHIKSSKASNWMETTLSRARPVAGWERY